MGLLHIGSYIYNAMRRAKKWPRGKNRVTVELVSIAGSYAALEWLSMLLGEAHQFVYRACHPAQIMNRLPLNQSRTEVNHQD